MNTASVCQKDKAAFQERVRGMMFADGFGPDEAEASTKSYAAEIFGNVSATAELRVRRAIKVISTGREE